MRHWRGTVESIQIILHRDGSVEVQDDGRGIPTDIEPRTGLSGVEVVFTKLHAGGKFDKGSYKVSGGLHGVGVSCVNALSTHMLSQVFRERKIYQQEYEKGHPPLSGEGSGRNFAARYAPTILARP